VPAAAILGLSASTLLINNLSADEDFEGFQVPLKFGILSSHLAVRGCALPVCVLSQKFFTNSLKLLSDARPRYDKQRGEDVVDSAWNALEKPSWDSCER